MSVVTAGSWQHVAVSFGDGNLTLYHNGTQVAQTTSSLNLTGNTEELWIGARQDGGEVTPGSGDSHSTGTSSK